MGTNPKRVKLRLAEFTRELVGKPYRLGETDCASLIMAFAGHVGVTLPDEWKGHAVSSYAELYRDNPEEAMRYFIEWAASAGHEIDQSKAFAGDLLAAVPKTHPEAGRSLLIHAGQDQALCVTEKRGVTFVPLRAYAVTQAWRWRDA